MRCVIIFDWQSEREWEKEGNYSEKKLFWVTKTKALAGGQGLCGPEVLKAYVDKMSFDDNKIKSCVGFKGLLGRNWWTNMWVQWHLGPGESLCEVERHFWTGSVESPGGQNEVRRQEDKKPAWAWRAFVGQMRARS